MREDNNPFRPALSKPVDDTVLANDPAPDNFVAGNDGFANHTAARNVRGGGPALRLDQMNMNMAAANNTAVQGQMPVADNPMTLGNPAGTAMAMNGVGMDMPSFGMAGATATPADLSPSMPTTGSVNTATAATSPVDPVAPAPKKTKTKKHFSLRRKKKTAEEVKPANNSETVFGAAAEASEISPLGFSPLDPSTPATGQLTDSQPQPTASSTAEPSPIEASLSAAAAAADGKPNSVNIKPTKANKRAGKTGQPKQLTISVLTIVFGVLFIASAALAVTFFMQKNSLSSELDDTKAQLSQLQDQSNNNTNSSNKASTQFDSLQGKIEELTKTNQDNAKTIENNKKTIDDLNKKNGDLTNQLTAAQNKLASDTSVSDNMKSLITTMCAAGAPYNTSSACVAQGTGATQPQQQPQQQSNNQDQQQNQ